MLRIGNGFDSHRFAPEIVFGQNIVLGGVSIPSSQALIAHSDGDALIHAIIDSLLGAMGYSDIGEIFPNTDKQYQDISSLVLLDRVREIIQKEKYSIINVDTVIICEQPKISSHKSEMKDKISDILQISPQQINIKAKTAEKLGAIGRGEGISVYSVCLLDKVIG